MNYSILCVFLALPRSLRRGERPNPEQDKVHLQSRLLVGVSLAHRDEATADGREPAVAGDALWRAKGFSSIFQGHECIRHAKQIMDGPF